MSRPSAGKEVLSYCNRCKLNLAHTIVVMRDDDTIGKVMCKTCSSVHAFKDSSSIKSRKVIPPKTKSRSKKSHTPIAEVWKSAMDGVSSPAKPYSISASFKGGDLIEHPSFGQGVVDKCIGKNKIEVIFETEIKTLVHNK